MVDNERINNNGQNKRINNNGRQYKDKLDMSRHEYECPRSEY
jgi:hypothetical protein